MAVEVTIGAREWARLLARVRDDLADAEDRGRGAARLLVWAVSDDCADAHTSHLELAAVAGALDRCCVTVDALAADLERLDLSLSLVDPDQLEALRQIGDGAAGMSEAIDGIAAVLPQRSPSA